MASLNDYPALLIDEWGKQNFPKFNQYFNLNEVIFE